MKTVVIPEEQCLLPLRNLNETAIQILRSIFDKALPNVGGNILLMLLEHSAHISSVRQYHDKHKSSSKMIITDLHSFVKFFSYLLMS